MRKGRTTGHDVLPRQTQQWNLTLLANMAWGGSWGGMTGNDWTVQFGYWGKSEWKNLTGAAHSAANPESHKYEYVPWEVSHVKTKVPGSGQQREVEGGEGDCGSLIWVRGQHKAKCQRTLTEDYVFLLPFANTQAFKTWCRLSLPLTHTFTPSGKSQGKHGPNTSHTHHHRNHWEGKTSILKHSCLEKGLFHDINKINC